MRRAALLPWLWLVPALLAPQPALAHGTPPVSFLAPAGPGNVVERGAPYTVSWYDPDLYPDDLMTLRIRPVPPAPYITFWPVEQIEGEPVAPAVPMSDPANALELSTAGLSPGQWFFWFDVSDPTGTGRYVAPAGVLTVVEPGEGPPPSIWFDQPSTSSGPDGESYEVVFTTFPTEGVTVDLSGSLNDLEGLALEPLATGLPGGTRISHRVSLRCVRDGAFGLFATVRDQAGREGSAFATGRISWRRPDGGELPADCPGVSPGDAEEPSAAPDGDGGGCGCGGGGGGSPGEALLGPATFLLLACAWAGLRQRTSRRRGASGRR